MTTDDKLLTRQVAIRLSDDDMTRLDALAESIPIATATARTAPCATRRRKPSA